MTQKIIIILSEILNQKLLLSQLSLSYHNFILHIIKKCIFNNFSTPQNLKLAKVLPEGLQPVGLLASSQRPSRRRRDPHHPSARSKRHLSSTGTTGQAVRKGFQSGESNPERKIKVSRAGQLGGGIGRSLLRSGQSGKFFGEKYQVV